MRFVALLVIGCLWTQQAEAAPTVVQNAVCNVNATTTCTTAGITVTAGNSLIMFTSFTVPGSVVATLSDNSGSNSYTHTAEVGTGMGSRMAYDCDVVGGSTTFTTTFSTSATGSLIAAEVSGLTDAACLDQEDVGGNEQTNPGTGTDAVVSDSITPTTTGTLIVGYTTDFSGATSTASDVGTNFTTIGTAGGGVSRPSRAEYRVYNSSAPIQATFTAVNAASDFVSRVWSFHAGGLQDCKSLGTLDVGGECA